MKSEQRSRMANMLVKIIVCVFAGLFAGVGTGFAGLSAACFITPMLVSFLDVPVYEAVGIALASDTLSSAVSAIAYTRYGHVDFKKSRWLLLIVLSFCAIGSLIAYFVSGDLMGGKLLGYWSIIASFGLGVFFIVKPGQGQIKAIPQNRRVFVMCLLGALIGLICGFQGAGGGMMLLMLLSLVLQLEFHEAVGTSVFIMTFTALLGAIFHFLMNGFPDLSALLICMVSTTLFSYLASYLANKMNNVKLKRITGILLALSGAIMLAYKIFQEVI